ncbi:MAG: InlB B-repeat-containing protein [Planctomycetota bacterium]|jgi:uncharacterized repeat protein (TIGR02543 family)
MEKGEIMNPEVSNLSMCPRRKYLLVAVLLVCFARPLWGAVQQNRISQFGITWTFDKNHTVGQFANGDYWIVGPVTIINIHPASVKLNGRMINGSMVNPSPVNGYTQGYDSVDYGKSVRPERYDPNLNVARPNGRDLSKDNPLILQPDCSLVSTISTLEKDISAKLRTAAVLTVLCSPAPEGSFRPPFTNIPKDIKFNKSQLDYSLLSKLVPVPNTPRLVQRPGDKQTASVERMFERPWLEHIPGFMARIIYPHENMRNYDRDVTTQVGIAALMLNLNFDDRKKEKLLIRFVQVGIDNYGVIQDGGQKNWSRDTGRKFPILFAGLILNDPDMKNIGKKSGDYMYTDPSGNGDPPPDLIRFEEDEMTFYVSQSDVDFTHGPKWRPDSRDAEKIPYLKEDIGLPEWGKVGIFDRTNVNKYWTTTYRQVIGHAYTGIVLAMHIMGIKDLWNNDALFDYTDRYKMVELEWTETSRFVKAMWSAYRTDYGPLWTIYPEICITAVGGTVVKTPAKAAYKLGERIKLKAVANPGYEFTGWSGALSGKTNPAVVIMHAHRSVTANFTASPMAAVPNTEK